MLDNFNNRQQMYNRGRVGSGCMGNSCTKNSCMNNNSCGSSQCGNMNSCVNNQCGSMTRRSDFGGRRPLIQGQCGCGKMDEICGMPLAMSYVPWQEWGETYELCKALEIGTIFPELNLPFMGRSCLRR